MINGLGAAECVNLLKQCLAKLHSVGVKIGSLTFDGLSTNAAMVKGLGCSLDSENLKTSFPHPVMQEQICIFFDPCHRLKLIRNLFGEKKNFIDGEGNLIKWDYIKELHKLQECEGLHLGN